MILTVLRAQVRIHHVNLRYDTKNQNLGVRFSRTELSEGPVLAAVRDLSHRIEGHLIVARKLTICHPARPPCL